MDGHRLFPAWLLAAVSIAGPAPDAASQNSTATVAADFSGDWAQRWEEVRLAASANRFAVHDEDGTAALRASSDNSASALWHAVDVTPRTGDRVVWRWKVEKPLSGNEYERQKRGDDYAARLFVIFDGEPFSRQARAVCYVWASRQPVGAVYPNPYFSNVTTVVLRSGTEQVGQWLREERDFVEDYRNAFGEGPETVTAVAVMVDTDDTRSRAVVWFDTVELRTGSAAPASERGH